MGKNNGAGKVLVTGGAGFIGSNVADAYLARGWDVTVVDDLSSGKRENVSDGATFIEMDVRDGRIRELFEKQGGFELVSHHAAQVDVRVSVDRLSHDADINIGGLLNVLEAAQACETRRVVFVSSGGVVYGNVDERPISETAPKNPESPYGVSKLTSEYSA